MLTGFTTGLLLITISELGDKTFFIGAILATRYPRRWVFLGVTVALFVMTVLSVLLGQVATVLPQHYVQWAAIALFLGFGIKLLLDARRMPNTCGNSDEQEKAEDCINRRPAWGKAWPLGMAICSEAFALTFIAEWGDRTQLATITLAAAQNPFGVTIGATLGHAICAAIAVLCGKLVAGKISERWLTIAGGLLFILFGLITALEG